MFSKKSLALLSATVRAAVNPLGLLVAVLVAGCSMPVGEKPAAPAKPAAKLGFDSDCLKQVKPALGKWVDGTAAPAELDVAGSCLENAVEIFKSKVVGDKQDEQTKEELRKFLESYVLKETKLSDAFMTEVMALKQVLVGGDESKITRSELERLKALLALARDLMKTTLPHMAIYTMKWQPAADADEANEATFGKAEAVLKDSVAKLMATIEANKTSYDLNRLPLLLEETRKIAGAEWSWLPKVREYLPLVAELKKSLVGGTGNVVAGGEWRRFGSSAARGFAQLLRYEFFLKNEKELLAENAKLGALERLGGGVLDLLADSVEQKPSPVLAKSEIVALLESARVAFPALKVTSGFVDELLAVKESLFGGTADGLTASDLRNARGKLPRLRALLEGLLKHKRYYLLATPSVLEGVSEENAVVYMAAAEKNLVTVGAEFAQLFVQPYDLRRLDALVREARASFGTAPANVNVTAGFDLAKYLPLVVAVKNLYFQDEGPIIAVKQYAGVFDLATRGYARFADFHYNLQPVFDAGTYENLAISSGRRSLGRLINEGLGLLQSFLTRRSPQVISVDEIMKVWTVAGRAGLLPTGLTEATMKSTLSTLFEKVLLEPEQRLARVTPRGLTPHAFAYVKGEFGAWYAAQAMLEEFELDAAVAGNNQKEILGRWDEILGCLKGARGARLSCPKTVPADAQKYASLATIGKVATELRRMFTSLLPLPHASARRLVIGETFPRYDKRSLSYLNLARAIARVLIQGYASKQGAPGSNIWLATRDDANRALAEFKPLMVELEFIEPDNTSFMTMRFLEANLFTPQGNGDALLDLREGTGIITHILSGLSHNSTIEKRIREEHCAGKLIPDPAGVKKKDRVPIACLLNAYRVEMRTPREKEATLGVALPDLSKYMLGLKTSIAGAGSDFDLAGAQSYDLMMMDLMRASGWKNEDSKTAMMKDVALIVHVMQYIETVMQRFDGSVTGQKNGVLTRKEAMNGYPLFRGTVNDLLSKDDTVAAISEQLGDSLTKASYAYVLYHGGIPSCAIDKAELMKWTLFPEAQKTIAAERNKLAEILGILSEAARKKPNETLPAKCYYKLTP